MRNLTLALVVVIGVLGGFYGGWRYSQSKLGATTPAAVVSALPSAGATAGGGTGGGGGTTTGGGAAGRGATVGQVTAVSGNVVTVHNPQTNQDVKVDISAGTVINKTTAGTPADIQPGATVTVTGQANADGSVSATAINIGQGLPGGGGGRGRPTPTPGT